MACEWAAALKYFSAMLAMLRALRISGNVCAFSSSSRARLNSSGGAGASETFSAFVIRSTLTREATFFDQCRVVGFCIVSRGFSPIEFYFSRGKVSE
jgi:hypothetical protein